MTDSSGTRQSLWLDTAPNPEHAALTRDVTADVCVVGAGISGLSVAYLLAREGKSVVVIDDGLVGSGETGRTTAHLANAIDDRFTEMERLHGREGSRLAAESHGAAIDKIEEIVRAENIDCDFLRLDGYLFLAAGDKPDLLDKELEAAHRAGLTGVEKIARAPIESFDTGPCLRFPRQGQFHPMKYMRALAEAITKNGGQIYGRTRAKSIEGGETACVKTGGGHSITAQHVVVATNSPVNDLVVMHTKQYPYRTYVVEGRVPKGSVPRALYWDTADPYHYIRTQPLDDEFDSLIVGGEDHETGQEDNPEERFRCLEEWTRERFKMLVSVDHRWSGQVLEPIDGLAYIGRNPMDKGNVYIATGDSGMGMTHGTIAGMLITDLIMGRENPWAHLYAPNRKTLKAAPEFVRDVATMAAQYADWLRPGDISSPDELKPGEGGLLRRGLKLIAVHRDDKGQIHERNAVCTHLGCVVQWNSAEKSWDCPCHGSRFNGYGDVLNGPAATPLIRTDSDS